MELVGVDPAPRMVVRSRTALGQDPRVIVEQAAAEGLPFTDRTFDLVVTTVSFDHWTDQQRGLAECARVLRDGGRLVLADLFAAWLRPTAGFGRRRRARTVELAARLLTRAGFRGLHWQSVYDLGPFRLVQAVVAVR